MASFQAKTRLDRQRMREKIKYRSYQFLANPEYGIPKKNSKKIQKIKEHHYGFFSSENRMGQAVGNAKKERSYRSNPFQPGPKYGFPKK